MDKILIIEDDPDSIEICKLFLENQSCEVISSNSAVNIIEIVKKHLPDLILMDWNMPDKSGIEALSEIKAIKEFQEIPILIISGVFVYSDDLKLAFNIGATDFLRKPLNELEFNARVSAALKSYSYYKEKERYQTLIFKKEIEETQQNLSKIKSEYDKKEREMIIYSNNYIRNSEFLNQLKNDIEKLLTEKEADLKKIIKLIEHYQTVNDSSNSIVYDNVFYNLNSDFIRNLKNKHQDLTNGELRLCAFFKMGYTNKEIAILCYMNLDAVRKAAFRIRKKLNMKNDNLTFILQFY